MALADLLLAGDPARGRWVVTGASMTAVDTLVHNWLHRSGYLHDLSAAHAYGPGCYAAGGCAAIIDAASQCTMPPVLPGRSGFLLPRDPDAQPWRDGEGSGLNHTANG